MTLLVPLAEPFMMCKMTYFNGTQDWKTDWAWCNRRAYDLCLMSRDPIVQMELFGGPEGHMQYTLLYVDGHKREYKVSYFPYGNYVAKRMCPEESQVTIESIKIID